MYTNKMSEILPPIRCSTCGSLLAEKFQQYITLKDKGYSTDEAFRLLGIVRPCCMNTLSNPSRIPTGDFIDPDYQSKLFREETRRVYRTD
jgi:DNA-directed RNA polymerase subunit N (RpoN/RPB10)